MATSTRVDRRASGVGPAGADAGVGAVVIRASLHRSPNSSVAGFTGRRLHRSPASQVVGGVDDGPLAGVVDEGVLDVERVGRDDALDEVLLAQAVQCHAETAA